MATNKNNNQNKERETKMNKIKVYNLHDYMINDTGKQPSRYGKIAILVGKLGTIVFDYEGVGFTENVPSDTIAIGSNDYEPNSKTIALYPQYMNFIPIQKIMDNATCEEMYLKEFMTKWNYNSRCGHNYAEILKQIEQIGLNPKEYIEEEKPSRKGTVS